MNVSEVVEPFHSWYQLTSEWAELGIIYYGPPYSSGNEVRFSVTATAYLDRADHHARVEVAVTPETSTVEHLVTEAKSQLFEKLVQVLDKGTPVLGVDPEPN